MSVTFLGLAVRPWEPVLEAAVVDSTGSNLATATLAFSQGETDLSSALPEILQQILTETGIAREAIRGVGLVQGMVDDTFLTQVKAQLPHCPLFPIDALVARMMGTVARTQGIAVHIGATVTIYGLDGPERRAQIGGWGPLLDRGGGYFLAREALTLLMAQAGSPQPSPLAAAILDALALEDAQALPVWLNEVQSAPAALAALAPMIIRAAAAGDFQAASLVARGADAIADAVQTVAQQLDLSTRAFDCGLAGSVLHAADFYGAAISQAIITRLPLARMHVTEDHLALGAARQALSAAGFAIRPVQAQHNAHDTIWATEYSNVFTHDLDLRTTEQIVGLMHIEDQRAVDAVNAVLPAVAGAVEAIAERMRRGGRLIYVGGGTSGRLGVLDASECPATFNTPREQVIAIMAGGVEALLARGEWDEDQAAPGQQAMRELHVGPLDSVVGITASGRTPFTLGAVEEARRHNALIVALVCNLPAPLAELANHVIAPRVGPEALAGSTRLKAGTAQKMVLNMLSTAVMVRLGKTYSNLMVDVRQDNVKLQARARRIVAEICDIAEEEAAAALALTAGNVKAAVLCVLAEAYPEAAQACLCQAQGSLRIALVNAQA